MDFKDYGFWAWDGAIEVWLYLLVQEIDKLESIPDWLKEAREHWLLQATVGFVGHIHPQLDDHLSTQDRINLLVMLSEDVLDWLDEQGEFLSQKYLNALGLPHTGAWGTGTADVPVAVFTPTGRKFIELLNGELKTTASTSQVF